MNISFDGRVTEISDYVMGRADDTDPENGAVEDAHAKVNNVAEMLGRLMSTLADKGILDAQDIVSIADECSVDEYEIELVVKEEREFRQNK